jgi:N utilization substance protein B
VKSTPAHERRRRARRRALQALYNWQLNPQDAGRIIAQFLDEQDFSNVDVELFELLVRGVTRDRETLDERLAGFLDRPGEQLDVTERCILRLAAWELLHQPGTPMEVILDEATELAHRFGAEGGYSFVNGVLDRAERQWRGGNGQGESSSGA